MTYVACKPKLRSVVKSSKYPSPGNWVEIGCAIVYYTRAAYAFSIKLNSKDLHGDGDRDQVATTALVGPENAVFKNRK